MVGVPQPPRRPKSASHLWQRLLLATLINHPELLDEFQEMLVLTDITEPGLDDLRQALITQAHTLPQGDGPGLRAVLADQGFGDVLDDILGPGTYESHRFAAPGAETAVARRGLADGHATFCRIRIGRELVEAGKRLGQDGSERNLSRVVTLRGELALPDPGPEDPD